MPIQPTGPVIVGVDGPVAAAAVDLAAREAALRDTPLVVVHASETPDADIHRRRRLLRAATARALAARPDLPVTAEAATGTPAAVLLERAGAAALVVLGQPRWRRGLRTGSCTVTGPLDRARTPVVVHRLGGTSSGPVLLGLVGAGCEPAIRFGFEEAALRGVPLVALAVGPIRDDEERELGETLTRWSEKYPDVPVSRPVRRVLDAAVTLTAASRGAALVVVGAPEGGDRTPRAIADVLASRAGCPVALVPGAGSRSPAVAGV